MSDPSTPVSAGSGNPSFIPAYLRSARAQADANANAVAASDPSAPATDPALSPAPQVATTTTTQDPPAAPAAPTAPTPAPIPAPTPAPTAPAPATPMVTDPPVAPGSASGILTEAAGIVAGARQVQHGEKERSFIAIVGLWNAYLAARLDTTALLTPADVCQMMVLMKMGRTLQGAAMRDHFVDEAGYAAIAGELALPGSTTSA